MEHTLLRVSYGSHARGEQDELSDIDVLELGSGDASHGSDGDQRLSISRYSWAEFERMSMYGSLFLLHLKMEGKIVQGRAEDRKRYSTILENLPSYKFIHRDLESFQLSVRDVSSAIDAGDTTIGFELGTLATVMRHASVLGCYLIQQPNFGRYSAIRTFTDAQGLGAEIADWFPELYMYRMAAARNLSMPPPPEDVTAVRWLLHGARLIEEVRRCAES